MNVLSRLPAELAARLQHNPFRRYNRYVEWENHSLLSETVCKRCDAVLTALGPDPRIPPRRRELKGTKERTIILESVSTRLRTNQYDTIEFEVMEPRLPHVPEGNETREEVEEKLGVHRTTICTECKKALLDGVQDLEEVQQLYEADLERMAIEDGVNGLSPERTRDTLTLLAKRKVTRILG